MEILADQAPKIKERPPCLWCKGKSQKRTGQGFTGFCKREHERMYIQRALDKLLREASQPTSSLLSLESKEENIMLRKARREARVAGGGKRYAREGR